MATETETPAPANVVNHGETEPRITRPARRALATDRFLLSLLSKGLGELPVRLVLWDGTATVLSSQPPVAELRIGDRRTLAGLVRAPELAFGEAYTTGRVAVEGDLLELLLAIVRSRLREHPRLGRQRAPWHLRHSLAASRENARHHYDLGNDFFRLWLDEELVYTCGYYADPGMTLEEAQRAKMEYVCAKLDLASGERVVEAGCGWGALALWMARHHGVTVDAYNVSHEQVCYARRRAEEEGLSSRVTFHEEDYRAISGRYDVFVSVGMLEHVGPENYPLLGSVIDRSLTERRGRGLLHFIGRDRPWPLDPWVERHVFPGAYPPTLAEVASGALEPHGLSVLDVENLRLHYARTTREWRTRFEVVAARVAAALGEELTRAWRLYLTGSEAAFTGGSLQLFQITFARSGENAIGWTRARLYEGGAGVRGAI